MPDTIQETPRLIDFKELSRLTTLRRSALYERINVGEFRPIKLGRKTVFAESEVREWVKAQMTRAEVRALSTSDRASGCVSQSATVP